MHYEITSAVKPGVALTSAQKNSSLFSEAPRIGTKTLRRGTILKLSDAEFKHHEIRIKRLLDAGAVEVKTVGVAVPVTTHAPVESPKPVVEAPVEAQPVVTAPVVEQPMRPGEHKKYKGNR